jgi:hypothetical protein
MQKNPYMETYVAQNGAAYTCYYYYPDARHAQKLLTTNYLTNPNWPPIDWKSTLNVTNMPVGHAGSTLVVGNR